MTGESASGESAKQALERELLYLSGHASENSMVESDLMYTQLADSEAGPSRYEYSRRELQSALPDRMIQNQPIEPNLHAYIKELIKILADYADTLGSESVDIDNECDKISERWGRYAAERQRMREFVISRITITALGECRIIVYPDKRYADEASRLWCIGYDFRRAV